MTYQPDRERDGQRDLSIEDVHTILRAARVGLQAYPGPIGELIDRELRAYVDTGRQLPADSIPERLLTGLLQTQERAPITVAEVERTLPARYRKGTPLRWELTPRTELPALRDEGQAQL
jgi:hypothetical protein